MVTLLKLGGSLVTRKDEPETVDDEALETALSGIADGLAERESIDVTDGLVLVHGGGSFGHYRATAHDVSESSGTADAAAIVDIHGAMGELNEIVVSRSLEAGIPAVPVRPLSLARRDADGLHLAAGQVDAVLAEAFVPVLHGDVVIDAGKGATILSGDELVVSLAESLDVTQVGLCSTVPGVLDSAGQVIPAIDGFDEVEAALGGSDSTDVTGGMAGKVRKLLDLDAEASIFGLADLPAFLSGDAPGTTIA